jgi:hypothetical protein
MRVAPYVLALLALGAASCSGDDGEPDPLPDTSTTAPPTDDGGDDGDDGEAAGEGTLAVRLEPTEGIFIEGFEVGLRFTDAASGEELERVVWSEYVTSLGPEAGVDAFYDAVYERPAAGTVRVGVDVNIGIGPGPEPPDLDAEPMPCELDVEVPAGETVTVQVSFDDASPECLQVVDD